MNIIFGNYGNDTLALIQWAYSQKLSNVIVVSTNTGWAASNWSDHVAVCREFVKARGFKSIELKPAMSFAQLVKHRRNFPSPKFHWCANFLKGLTLLDWLDEYDVFNEAVILLAKRRAEAKASHDLPEFVEQHELYEDRKVWYPLYKHSLQQRDLLIKQAGFDIMKHRSLECDPCIYNQRRDFLKIHSSDVSHVSKIEGEISRNMFPPEQFDGAQGFEHVVKWVKQHPDEVNNEDAGNGERDVYYTGCGSEFGCGL